MHFARCRGGSLGNRQKRIFDFGFYQLFRETSSLVLVPDVADLYFNILKWNKTTLEVVEQYSYLGVIITNDGRIDKEINNRIKKTNQIY